MPATVHSVALRLLARRALSAGEVRQRLARRGFAPAAIEAEVERLRRAGLLDDLEVARATCRAQLRKGTGRRHLMPLLSRRLLDDEAACQALGEVTAEMENEALRHALARAVRRHPEYGNLPQEREKVVRYLLTRGFAPVDVRRALAVFEREETDAAEAFDQGDP